VDGPPILREWKQAIQREIHTLANAHAGVPLEQQEITKEIITVLQFLLDELILFRQQRARGEFIAARDISPTEEMSKRWYLVVPGQVLQHTVHISDADDDSDLGEWRGMGT
jgi:hypothetical protein